MRGEKKSSERIRAAEKSEQYFCSLLMIVIQNSLYISPTV